MYLYEEDGCFHMAEQKYNGLIAGEQAEFETEWANNLTSKLIPIEKLAETILPRLKLKIAQGETAFVIGAGVSISCGLPSWDNLVQETFINLLEAKQMYADEILSTIYSMKFSRNLVQLTQALTAIFSESEIAEAVKTIINKEIRNSSDLLYAICDLIEHSINVNDKIGKPTYILTFNYDTLIEDELKKRNVNLINCDKSYNMESTNCSDHVIIHLHGSVSSDNKSNIVLTEHSYGEAYLCSKFSDPLSFIIQKGITPLFVGFSFNDTYVRQILHKCSILKNGSIAIGLLAKSDLIIESSVNVSSEYTKYFTPNDKHGWMISGESPIQIREKALKKIREQFARVVLNSIGVEWWSTDDWDEIPNELRKLID